MNTKKKGILIVVSGFSGAGKGTIMKGLLAAHPHQYALSVSATTRAPRPGEVHGREYFFVSEQEFESMIQNGELIEYAKYVQHYYGTPRKYVEEKLAQGMDVILEIEIQGALKVKEKYPDALLLFVTTPSARELKERLIGRGTEDADTIAARLQRAAEEAAGMDWYDYLVINDDLEQCMEEVHSMIVNEHSRVFRNQDNIRMMIEELTCFVKGD